MNAHVLTAIAWTLVSMPALAISGPSTVDDMRATPAAISPSPPAVQVEIDIKPGDWRNRISLDYYPGVAVSVMSSAAFDPRAVVTATLRFGRTGTEESFTVCRLPMIDLNDDARPDLTCVFDVEKTGWRRGDTTGSLAAVTNNGQVISGSGPVTLRGGHVPTLRRMSGHP